MGVTTPGDGRHNFAIYAPGAARVALVLYPDSGELELPLDSSTHRSGAVWHAELAGLEPPLDYAWRVDGSVPLLDPYARIVTGAEAWGSGAERAGRRKELRSRIEVAQEPDGVAAQGAPGTGELAASRPPRPAPREPTDRVIYELSVRAFTRDPSSGVSHPGTYRGLIETLPYLVDLGVTTLELLPVMEFDEHEIARRQPETGEPLRNLWGYSPLSFFAPKAGFAADPEPGAARRELLELIDACHAAGLEVILDVVFNHTAEKDLRPGDPVYSWAGLGREAYYLQRRDGTPLDVTGCGHTFDAGGGPGREMILASLRYWANEIGVDGFRFDLAPALARGRDGEPAQVPALLVAIGSDPELAGRVLIAEPWDVGGSYWLGRFPAWGPWAEWNDRCRDDLRRFVRGDPGLAVAVAWRLLGSPDVYGPRAGAAGHSVNFVTCHDGFTLWDLVSYDRKHNLANGEDDRDGSDWNHSWNCGVEGPTADPEVLALRRRQARNLLTLLLCARGVPMLRAGDERARTQGGNNNPYCQDNAVGWLDWTETPERRDLHRFVRELLRLRRQTPAWRRGGPSEEGTDPLESSGVVWHGERLGQPDWTETSACLAVEWLEEEDEGEGEGQREGGRRLYLAANPGAEARQFELPLAPGGHAWRWLVNTAAEPPADIHQGPGGPWERRSELPVPARTCVLLAADPVEPE